MSLILDGTSGLSDVDGSAATPAIRGTDANTGIFFGTDIIGFSEGGVEAMRINASGNLQTLGTIGVGNATPSTSGSGITFPATQSASSDANTLDDYEEGTWTPTVTAQSGSITSYSITGAKYTKVGNIVRASLYINMTNSGTASGTASVTLPFAPVDTNWAGCGGEVGAVGFSLNVFGSAGGMSFRKYENSTAFGTNYGYLLTAVFQV